MKKDTRAECFLLCKKHSLQEAVVIIQAVCQVCAFCSRDRRIRSSSFYAYIPTNLFFFVHTFNWSVYVHCCAILLFLKGKNRSCGIDIMSLAWCSICESVWPGGCFWTTNRAPKYVCLLSAFSAFGSDKQHECWLYGLVLLHTCFPVGTSCLLIGTSCFPNGPVDCSSNQL